MVNQLVEREKLSQSTGSYTKHLQRCLTGAYYSFIEPQIRRFLKHVCHDQIYQKCLTLLNLFLKY